MKKKKVKFCQSCGIPLRKDPNKGGTEADGTKTLKYCSYCYTNGAFTEPNLTADEMRQLVKRKLKETGYPGFIIGWVTKGIPKLERWKVN